MSSKNANESITKLSEMPLILLLALGTDGPAPGSEMAAEDWALLVLDVKRLYPSVNFDFIPHGFKQVRTSTGLVTMLAIAKPK